MTPNQTREAVQLERELADLASKEKAMYKRQVLAQASRLLRDLLQGDDDEPALGCTDD